LIIKLRRSIPLIAFGLAWILITFSINLAPRSNVIFEHKLYLISFGFLLTAVALLSNLVRHRGALTWILLCLISVLALVAFQRNKIWKDEFSLWNNAVGGSPHKARPYYNRGIFYYRQGKLIQAISDFTMAVELNPAYAEAYNNRGSVYYTLKNFPQAISDYTKAIELDPALARAFNNRGLAYYFEKDYDKAWADALKAQLEGFDNPGFIRALKNASDRDW
jgi:tetratricopeptide (TPR) repeat protein